MIERGSERSENSPMLPEAAQLGTPVVPVFPFCFEVFLLKLNIREKGNLIIKGLLGNVVNEGSGFVVYHGLKIRLKTNEQIQFSTLLNGGTPILQSPM